MVAVLCYAAGAVAEEKRPDQRHLQAQTAYDEAKRLSEAGEYALAVKQGEHALVLAEAALGGSDPLVAGCLDLLGSLHRLQGEYAQAEPLHQRALAIREQALDKSHPDVAKALHNLATLYLDQGLYTRAEPLYGSSSSAAPPLDSTLVTALELAGLDLWGTELVVLSACNTGSGDVKLGQGVYGLHRAFVVAGAETVVMSLWKVSDNSTSQLMEAYYRNLLAGQGRASALREAMRALRLIQPHPHYWAPFIVLGRDTPLRSLAPPQELPAQ